MLHENVQIEMHSYKSYELYHISVAMRNNDIIMTYKCHTNVFKC